MHRLHLSDVSLCACMISSFSYTALHHVRIAVALADDSDGAVHLALFWTRESDRPHCVEDHSGEKLRA